MLLAPAGLLRPRQQVGVAFDADGLGDVVFVTPVALLLAVVSIPGGVINLGERPARLMAPDADADQGGDNESVDNPAADAA
jgi:hypothetical protein